MTYPSVKYFLMEKKNLKSSLNKFESIVGSEIDAIDRKPIGLTDASPKPKQSFFSDRTETNRVEMMKNEKFNHRLRLRLWQTKQQANIIGVERVA